MVRKNIKILFRTAGGKAHKKELGLGHIYRCINLASEFKKNKVFFLIEDFGGTKEIVSKYGFKNITIMKPEIKQITEIEQIKKIVQEEKIDVTIMDHFHISKNVINKIHDFCKIVSICDLKKKELPGDLIVNGFIGFKNLNTKNNLGVKCLLGPKYQILNKKFSNKTPHIKKYDILITFGGYDEKNIIKIIAKSLERNGKKLKIKIILGPVAKKSNKIKKWASQNQQNIKIIKETRKMYNEINKSKFGICSGGITTYEFAAMKVPFAIICDELHQLSTAKIWNKKKIGKNLGLLNKKTPKKICKLLDNFEEIRRELKVENIVDGEGSKRITSEILKMF